MVKASLCTNLWAVTSTCCWNEVAPRNKSRSSGIFFVRGLSPESGGKPVDKVLAWRSGNAPPAMLKFQPAGRNSTSHLTLAIETEIFPSAHG